MTLLGEATLLATGSAVLSCAGVALVLRRARARGMLDMPNERSSHTVPTPRGGGLAIAAVVCTAVAVACANGRLDVAFALALLCGGAAVAAVGWFDDVRSLSARFRAAVHTAAATGVIVSLGGFPSMSLGAMGATPLELSLGVVGGVLAVVFVVWMTNLFNFMDGIDGLTGAYACVVCALAAGLVVRDAPGLRFVAIATAGACAGFLVWNWSPARIFMGDVGSGFLGFVIGALVVASEHHVSTGDGAPSALWLVLLTVFVVDATTTLVRRVLHREAWYSAHRQHAYQRLVQAGWSHAQVVIGILTVTVVDGALVFAAARNASLVAPGLLVAAVLGVTCYALVERKRPMR